MKQSIIKIAIVGPESSGKTTLAMALAKKFNMHSTSEFARNYLTELNRQYNLNDIIIISQNQLKIEQNYVQNNPTVNLLFCDTTLLVSKIWAIVKYGNCPKWILENYHANEYKLHILCNVDIPWVHDPLRENPEIKDREVLFDRYEQELIYSNANYIVARGNLETRLNFCSKAIDNLSFIPN